MPELPEVETVCGGLRPVFVGKKFKSVEQNRPDLRFPFPENFVECLTGAKVKDLTRRAKYVVVHLDRGMSLIMHLGMSGRFSIIEKRKGAKKPGNFVHDPTVKEAHDHVVFNMSSGDQVRYNDARRFGFMDLVATNELDKHKFFKNLGIEPLDEGFDADFLAEAAFKKSTPLKSFLLDQRVIAGLGNIYVCEALFRTKLSPKAEAGVLCTKAGKPTKKCGKLVEAVKSVLKEAIDAGGSTLRDHRQTDGSLGYFQHSFAVYGREGAVCVADKCNGIIQRITQSGRSTFYCPKCQKL